MQYSNYAFENSICIYEIRYNILQNIDLSIFQDYDDEYYYNKIFITTMILRFMFENKVIQFIKAH